MQGQKWQDIVADHGPAVWQTAYRLLGNHTDAADCFQETFLAAVEISRRQYVRNLPGLLVRLATTRAIDRLRQRNRSRQRQTDAPEWEQLASGKAGPLDHAQTNELAIQLRQAIGRLPPKEGRVFCLRHLNDMSYRQIARELSMRTSAVGVSLYRAKAKLREALSAGPIQQDEVPNEKA